MKIKLFLLVLLFVSNIFANEIDVKNLTEQQKETLKEIKKEGYAHGLGYTLMAIAIKESKLGEYMVNLDTKDFGLYQINLKSALNRNNMKDTTWNRNVLASKLVSDFNFATKNAIDELAYWQKFHKNNWSKIWGSYNAGFKFNSKEARAYSKEIASIIEKLRKIDV